MKRKKWARSQVLYTSAEIAINKHLRKKKIFEMIDSLESLNTYERRVLHAYLGERIKGSRATLPPGTLQLLGIKGCKVAILNRQDELR